jgi:hypothetical protein
MSMSTSRRIERNAARMVHDRSHKDGPWRLSSEPDRFRSRAEYAHQVFAPTPVASAFETGFAQRFYRHVQQGGSPDADAFIARERTRRGHRCYTAGAATATVLAVVLIATTPPGYPDLDGAADFVAAWIASAIWLLVPVLAGVRVVRRRYDRHVTQMVRDRAAYRSYLQEQRHEDAQTTHRLRELGIDL